MAFSSWNNTTNYTVGTIVIYESNYYECIQINGPSTTIVEPTVTALWDSYWKMYVNFPSNIPELTSATNPSSDTDMANILTYQNLINSGNFVGAQNFLIGNQTLINKLLTAGRYNALIDTLNQIVNYLNDDDGLYRKFINTNINAYKDINEWDDETDYEQNNIVIYNYNVYKCLQANGDSSTVIEPTVTSGWENYWELVVKNQKQYMVSTSLPQGIATGDLWFKDVTSE